MKLVMSESAVKVASTNTKPAWSCRVVRDFEQLEALREPWLDLMQRSAMNEAMLTPMWLFTWWKIYGQDAGGKLRVGLFNDGDRLVGIAPFFMHGQWVRPGIRFRRLQPLGVDVDEQDGVCSDYLNVICEVGSEQQMARAVVEHLQNGDFGKWDDFVLPSMDGDGPMPELLASACRDAGWVASCEQTASAPYIRLGNSWDDYVAAVPKRHRYLLRRTLRDFDQWVEQDVVYRRVQSADELEEGKFILTKLHQERWQDVGESGVFAASRFRRFHDQLMPQLLEAGALELVWITVRGEPVAVDYSIIWNGKQYVYQGGRKIDVPQGQRPGVVIAAHGIKKAIQRGLREFDFLAGDVVYKRQLALASRPIVTLRAVQATWKERLRLLGERGVACLRSVRNRVRRMVKRKPESESASGDS